MTHSEEALEMMQCARCGGFSGPEVLCARCDEGPEEREEDGVDAGDDLNAEADAAVEEMAREALTGTADPATWWWE